MTNAPGSTREKQGEAFVSIVLTNRGVVILTSRDRRPKKSSVIAKVKHQPSLGTTCTVLIGLRAPRTTVCCVLSEGSVRRCGGDGALAHRAGAGGPDGAPSSFARPRLRAPSRGKRLHHA